MSYCTHCFSIFISGILLFPAFINCGYATFLCSIGYLLSSGNFRWTSIPERLQRGSSGKFHWSSEGCTDFPLGLTLRVEYIQSDMHITWPDHTYSGKIEAMMPKKHRQIRGLRRKLGENYWESSVLTRWRWFYSCAINPNKVWLSSLQSRGKCGALFFFVKPIC